MKYIPRICYKKGIEKEENKLFEFHKFCNCSKCKFRYKYLKQIRNCLTVTVDDENKFDEVEKFMDNWKCNNGIYRFQLNM